MGCGASLQAWGMIKKIKKGFPVKVLAKNIKKGGGGGAKEFRLSLSFLYDYGVSLSAFTHNYTACTVLSYGIQENFKKNTILPQ